MSQNRFLIWKDPIRGSRLNIYLNLILLGGFFGYNLVGLFGTDIIPHLNFSSHLFYTVFMVFGIAFFSFRVFYQFKNPKYTILFSVTALVIIGVLGFYFTHEMVSSAGLGFYSRFIIIPFFEESERWVNFVLIYDLLWAVRCLKKTREQQSSFPLENEKFDWRLVWAFLLSHIIFTASHYRVYSFEMIAIFAMGIIYVFLLVLTKNYVLIFLAHSFHNYARIIGLQEPPFTLLDGEIFGFYLIIHAVLLVTSYLIYCIMKEEIPDDEMG